MLIIWRIVVGALYYARVAASNGVGLSPWAVADQPVAPESAPDAPATITISALSVQSGTPITTLDVSWEAPGNATGDGGSEIIAYFIEWYTAEAICEEQLVRLTWDQGTTPGSNAGFVLQFSNGRQSSIHGVTTSKLPFDTSASRLRDALMNLGYSASIPYDSQFTAGALEVTRTSTQNFHGYSWSITFADCAPGGENEGDLVPINVPVDTVSDSLELDIIELRPGSRSLGRAEEQIIRIFGNKLSVNDTEMPVLGYWRLGFDGSVFSNYLPSKATPKEVEEALELLSTVNQVKVSVADYELSPDIGGLQWRVTFLTNVGDQPTMYHDSTYLYSAVPGGSVSIEILGADNAIDETTGLKLDSTIIGETPVRYESVHVGADEREYTINGLESGVSYIVRISAINNHGAGPPKTATSYHVPQQIPDPPTNLTLSVNYGDDDSLTIRFAEPESDGGAAITHYRVELDPSDTFDDPIRQDIQCPSANKHAVWRIQNAGDGSANPIVAGSYALTLSVGGNSFTSDPIPYNAVGSAKDEVGVRNDVPTVGASGRTFAVRNNSALVVASSSLEGILFDKDIITITGQQYKGARYRISMGSTDSFSFNLTDPVTGIISAFVGVSDNDAVVTRIYGGRGSVSTSLVFCETSGSYCSTASGRIAVSGSVQSKFEALTDAISAGVKVSRFGPDESNGFTWFVTFLDNSPESNALDFSLSLSSNSLEDINGTVGAGSITLTKWQDGETYADCTGIYHVVPVNGGLQNGLLYYARVTAINSLGYSLPQVAPSPEKPQTVPGRPTSVVLSTISATQLRVQFSSPSDDGGDAVSSYLVEYATSSDFSKNYGTATVTYLDGGSPFYKTLNGLTKGSHYYVRVRAGNSQGYGEPQLAAGSATPYEESSSPSNPRLGVTSDSMLTVGYDEPLDDGGDIVTYYRVEWDTMPNFNSLSASPHKGAVNVEAAASMSYTIDELSVATLYYVRVIPINLAGYGAATPTMSARPSLQVPGVPRSISASSSIAGAIDVAWSYPRIPAHGIPCNGFVTKAAECPVPLGGSLPESTGGSAIIEYEVEWNEREAFDGTDGGSITTTSTSLTVAGLTEGRRYYLRVLARNSVGSGKFCENSGSECSSIRLYALAPNDS